MAEAGIGFQSQANRRAALPGSSDFPSRPWDKLQAGGCSKWNSVPGFLLYPPGIPINDRWQMAPQHHSLRVVMAFLFGILVLIAMAGLALALGIDVRRENRTIQALNLDADQAQAALLALVDAETGFRGFALTGDEAYLQPYFQGLERLSLIESASPLLFDSKLKATGSILCAAASRPWC